MPSPSVVITEYENGRGQFQYVIGTISSKPFFFRGKYGEWVFGVGNTAGVSPNDFEFLEDGSDAEFVLQGGRQNWTLDETLPIFLECLTKYIQRSVGADACPKLVDSIRSQIDFLNRV